MLRFQKLFSAFAFKTRCSFTSFEGTTVELKAPGEDGHVVFLDGALEDSENYF